MAGVSDGEDGAASEEDPEERRAGSSEDGEDAEEEEEEVEEYLDEGRPDDVADLTRRAAALPADMQPVYRSVGCPSLGRWCRCNKASNY